MKLEFKHVAPYAPYRLKIMQYRDDLKLSFDCNLISLSNDNLGVTSTRFPFSEQILYSEAKLILRPLSDLTKEIEVNGEYFIPIKHIFYDYRKDLNLFMDFKDGVLSEFWLDYKGELKDNRTYVQESTITLIEWMKLFEWHFDVFGLIPKNLAMDINTL